MHQPENGVDLLVHYYGEIRVIVDLIFYNQLWLTVRLNQQIMIVFPCTFNVFRTGNASFILQ